MDKDELKLIIPKHKVEKLLAELDDEFVPLVRYSYDHRAMADEAVGKLELAVALATNTLREWLGVDLAGNPVAEAPNDRARN